MTSLREALLESLESPRQTLRKFWLSRYAIFFASFFVLIGPLGVTKGITILGNGFLIGKISQMAAITVMSLVGATLLLKQITLVFQQAHERFSDIAAPQPIAQSSWSWLKVSFLAVAGLSLPMTCWVHSMGEAGGEFSDDPEMTFGKGWIGLTVGLLVYLILHAVSGTARTILRPSIARGPLLSMPFLESIRVGISRRFQRFQGLFQHGHFELLIDFTLLLLFYLVLYALSLNGEMTPEDMFTSPFFLVLTLTLVSMFLSALSYFLDYYRVPTMLVVLFLLLLGYVFSSFDHRFPVVRIESRKVVRDDSPFPNAPEGAIATDPEVQDASRYEDHWIVVAPGGGIHASAWTGQVLAGLHERYGDEFKKRLRLISAVSGGSVGSMFYLDHFEYLQVESDRYQRNLEAVVRRSSTSSLEALAWGASFPDLARLFLGNWIQEDRGMVQERRWLRRMDIEGDDFGPTLYGWKRKADAGVMPHVVFNATEAETGRRVLFSTYPFGGTPLSQSVPFEAQAIDFLTIANEQFDLPVSTAVRLSATFPYVAAAAMPAKDTLPLGHIVDGGYVDNEGLLTALDFIRMEEEAHRKKTRTSNAKPSLQRRYVIIRILHSPPVKDHLISPIDPGRSGSGWEYASFGPLMAMSNVRMTSQRERGEIELTLLKEAMRAQRIKDSKEPDSQVLSVVIQFTPPDGYKAPPLNWRLSPRQRVAYKTAWERLAKEADETRLQLAASRQTSGMPPSTQDEFYGLRWFEYHLRPPTKQ